MMDIKQVPESPINPTLKRYENAILPALEIRPSEIKNAGLGLFATTKILKNSIVTEYGGRIVNWDWTRKLQNQGLDTHLITLDHGLNALDAAPRLPLPFHVDFNTALELYMIDSHMVASFANDPCGTGQKANTVYHRVSEGRKYMKENPSYSSHFSGSRIFLKAKRDIEPGEEILVSYGRSYQRRHFTNE